MQIDDKNVRLIVLAVIVLVWIVWNIFKGWRQGRALFTLKKLVNNCSWPVNIVLALYIMIVSASLIAPINEWSMNQASRWTSNPPVHFIFMTVPLACVFLIIYIVIKVGTKQWISYSDKEKIWLKEEDSWYTKFVKRHKILRIICGKNDDKPENKNPY